MPSAGRTTRVAPGGAIAARDNILVQEIAVRPRPLQIAEARRRLSALVERVARGGASVVIGRYGRERAVLMGMEEYELLTKKRKQETARPRSLRGSLELLCSPEELQAERRRLGQEWLARIDRLADRLLDDRHARRPRRRAR
jgi:prevent-host-death family protein